MATTNLLAGVLPNTKFLWGNVQFWKQDAGKNYSLTQTASDTLRFEVRSGDVWSLADKSSINRAEVASTVQIANGTPIKVAYTMNVEKAGDASAYWTVLGQFHQNDYAGAPNNSPPFSISMSNGKMTVVIGYTNASGQTTYKTVFTDTANIKVGHDYKFDIDVTFDPNGKGHLSVVRDGVKIVAYDGALGYSTQSSVYWKEGIYRPASTETMAVSYSGLSLSTGTPIKLSDQKVDKPYSVDQYGADGKLATTTFDNADGSVSVKTYDATGHVATLVTKNLNGTTTTLFYDKAGTVSQKVLTNADTSRTIDTWGISGKSYTAERQVIDKNGQAVSLERFTADGKVELSQTFGKYAVTTFNQYDASGNLALKSVTQASGTREVTLSNIKDQDYTSEQRSYDAAGTMTKLVRYHDDGSLAYSQSKGASGSMTYMSYDAKGNLLQKSVTMADGTREYTEYDAHDATNPTMRINYSASGDIIKNTQFRDDGSTVIYHDKIVGQTYASDAITYDASGKVVLIVRYHADKTLEYKQQVGADGSTTYYKYDAAGTMTAKTVAALDGSKDVYQYGLKGQGFTATELSYNSKGALTHMVQLWDDGSKRVSDYGITGKSYTTENVNYDAKGLATNITRYHSDGTPDYIKTVSADGSGYEAFHNAKGQQTLTISLKADGSQVMKSLAADTVMTSGKGNDQLYSFGQGSDKFVFHDDFGKDTIYNFNAGTNGVQDIIQFDKSVVQDFAHLHMTQQGADVLISVSAHDTITLKGIALSHLTSQDFLFV